MALPGVNPTYQYLDNQNSGADGTILGQTTAAKIAFYGKTPVVQPTSASQAAIATTAAVSISATQWGYSTSTQADAIVTLANRIRTDLVTLGLLKGS